MRSYRLLFPHLRPGLPTLILGIGLLMTVDFLQLMIPRFIKGAVDALASGRADGAVIVRYVGLVLLVALLTFFLRYAWRQLIFGLARRIEEALRNRLLAHLVLLSPSFYQRRSDGGPDGPCHQRPGGGPHGPGHGPGLPWSIPSFWDRRPLSSWSISTPR